MRVTATPLVLWYYFYDSLARLATYPGSSAEAQAEFLQKVVFNQGKMRHWAEYAPMNFLHKYYLVQAETARVLGQFFEAEEFYEQAIQGAKDSDYLQEEALAYELAAKFYLSRSREKVAQTYMREAYYCYGRWGAKAKVADLEARYPQLLTQSSGTQAIARSCVRLMGGDISVSSQISKGTVFKFYMTVIGNQSLDHKRQQLTNRDSLQPSRRELTAIADSLSPAALAALPADLIANLREAILALDVEQIETCITQIHELNAPLGNAIAVLAKGFKYRELLAFVQSGTD